MEKKEKLRAVKENDKKAFSQNCKEQLIRKQMVHKPNNFQGRTRTRF